MDQSDFFGGAEGCVFCQIRERGAHAWIVHEDRDTLAFLDRRPLLRGHTLVIPKAHHETLVDTPAELSARVFENARRIARAVEGGLQAQGSFLAVNTRVHQSVPHFHVHVVPRWQRDGLFGRRLVWFRRGLSKRDAPSIRDAIAAALELSPPD